MRAFVLNKPSGCISAARDFADRPTIYDHVPTHFPRLAHVGRLDFNTEGLLLFTDDGRLAQALANPGFAGVADPETAPPIVKVYRLKLRDRLDPDDRRIARLREPLVFRSGPVTKPADVRFVEHRTRATWLEVRIAEGRNRQIRRLCERSRLQVLKLRRIAIGPLELGELKLRWCRPLERAEIEELYAAAMPLDPVPEIEPIDDGEAARLSRPPAPTGGPAPTDP